MSLTKGTTMPPGLQRRFCVIILRALMFILYRQQHPDWKEFDSQSESSTKQLFDEMRQLRDEIHEGRW